MTDAQIADPGGRERNRGRSGGNGSQCGTG